MSESIQQTNLGTETESFEAFDQLTDALEHIDSYNPSVGNKEVLLEAQDSLRAALAAVGERRYLKAEYFQAIISYLNNNSGDAIKRFESMGESAHNSGFKDEVAYNLAAAYAGAGKWKEAIDQFEEVIKNTADTKKTSQDNYELHLMAQAGLAHSYAGRFNQVRDELNEQQRQGEETDAGLNLRTFMDFSTHLQEQYESAQDAAKNVLDRDVIKEAEQVIRDAYTTVEWWTGAKTIELLPAEPPPKKKWQVSRKTRVIIVAAIVVLLMISAYIELFVGWDYFLRWFTGS